MEGGDNRATLGQAEVVKEAQAMRQTIIKSLPRPVPRPLLTGTRAWVIALGLLALVLLALIGRDTILAKPAAAPLRLATVGRGTVRAQVSGTGSLVPAGPARTRHGPLPAPQGVQAVERVVAGPRCRVNPGKIRA